MGGERKGWNEAALSRPALSQFYTVPPSDATDKVSTVASFSRTSSLQTDVLSLARTLHLAGDKLNASKELRQVTDLLNPSKELS